MARKRSRRANKKGASTKSPQKRTLSLRLRLELTALEIASGHDGLLRGMPEPVVVFGAFLIAGAEARPLGRAIIRLKTPEGRFPSVVEPAQAAELVARTRADEGSRAVLLAIAVEEDATTDIERIYAHLSEARSIRVWDAEAAIPSPATLAELGAGALSRAPFGVRVNVLEEGHDLRDICKADDFVGASAVVLPITRHKEIFRLAFVSPDRRNDWTAVLSVSID